MRQLDSPLFIGGFPSGGTDLLKNILNAHPDIHISGEMPFLFKLKSHGFDENYMIKDEETFDQLKSHLLKHDVWNNLERLEETQFSDAWKEQSIQQFLKAVFSQKDVPIWGNKTPQNTENIDNLTNLFPESKYIIIVRDVRDVVLSWRKKWGKNYYLTAAKWNSRMNVSKNPTVLIIRYEDLLNSIDEVTRKMSTFLGIEWSENFLNYQDYVEKTVDGKINYGKALKADNHEKWKLKLSQKSITRIEQIAYNTLSKHGYPISHAKKHVPLRKHEKFYGFLRDALAMVFVGNRASNKNSFIARFKMIYKQIILRF